MKKAVIYARFSSDRQSELSIDAQTRACREYAERNNLLVIGIYADEAISGTASKTEQRKQYQRMLSDCKQREFETILIHKYDRVARSLAEHVNLEGRLKKNGIDLIAVAQDFGTSNEAKIMRALMWSMSEYYSDNLSAEVRKGHKEIALKGLHNGGYAPFGYDVVGQRYVINPLEAEFVRRIFSCALNREGFKEIIAELNSKGITGKRGKPFAYPSIYGILRNEKYTGVYLYTQEEHTVRERRRTKENAIRVEGAIPPIIDKETFMEVQRIMTERKQSGRKSDYLCSGLVFCQCGAKMHGFTSKRKGHEYRYYKCSAGCGVKLVQAEEVERTAIDYLRSTLTDSVQEQIADKLRTYEGAEKDRLQSFRAAVKKKINQKQNEYDTLMKNLSAAVLPAEVIQDISGKMQTLKEEIQQLQNAEPPTDYTTQTVKNWLNSIKAAPDKKAVHLFIERIDTRQTENKTDYNVKTTLQSVLEILVAGEGFEPTTSGL